MLKNTSSSTYVGHVGLDLSTTSNSDEKAVVDIKLLQSFFRDYVPARLDEVKMTLKNVIDNCDSMQEIGEAIDEYMYITRIATLFHQQPVKEPAGSCVVG